MKRQTAREMQEQRLKRWGDAPDTFNVDAMTCAIFRKYGVDPKIVLEEICWKRRHNGTFDFCSGRSLSRNEIRHEVLETVPFTVPPLRLKVGKKKDPGIVVDRMLPASSYDIEYECSESQGYYFIRSGHFPPSYLVGLEEKKVSEVIGGIPDNRKIRAGRNTQRNQKNGIMIWLAPEMETHTVAPVDHRLIIRPANDPMTFSDGSSFTLPALRDIEPDNHGLKMFGRSKIDMACVSLTGPYGTEQYIAVLPHAQSMRPTLNLKGADRSIIFDCHLVNPASAIPSQISACMHAAKAITINDEAFLASLISKMR